MGREGRREETILNPKIKRRQFIFKNKIFINRDNQIFIRRRRLPTAPRFESVRLYWGRRGREKEGGRERNDYRSI